MLKKSIMINTQSIVLYAKLEKIECQLSLISQFIYYLFKDVKIGTWRHQIDMSHTKHSTCVGAGILSSCPNRSRWFTKGASHT